MPPTFGSDADADADADAAHSDPASDPTVASDRDPRSGFVSGTDDSVGIGTDSARSHPSDPTPDRLSRIGHRGCITPAPENTVAAVVAAAPHVDMVEVDVRPCGTGEIVVFHDETLGRLTDGSGRVDETPLSTLREREVLASGEPIPTLRELLDAMAVLSDPPVLNVEIKASGIAPTVVARCADAPLDVLYSSFHESVLRGVRTADPDAPLAVVCRDRPSDAIEFAAAVDAVAIHPWKRLIVDTNSVDDDTAAADGETPTAADGAETHAVDGKAVVETAHARGLAVNAWSADTPTEIRRLRAAGVDGVIADRWTVFDAAHPEG
ncbi:MAG: glycerophosphodiester phosphodiesterase [Halorubrum sp.]